MLHNLDFFSLNLTKNDLMKDKSIYYKNKADYHYHLSSALKVFFLFIFYLEISLLIVSFIVIVLFYISYRTYYFILISKLFQILSFTLLFTLSLFKNFRLSKVFFPTFFRLKGITLHTLL